MPIEGEAGGPAPPPRKRCVVFTGQFKKDFRREEKGRHRSTLRADLERVVDMLADDVPLPTHMVDHPLTGNWKRHRDCHIKPDLVLIYRKAAAKAKPSEKPSQPELHLVRLGSHSELGI